MRIPKGRVVDSIPVGDTLNESFALYLPRSFKGDTPSALIVVLDPQGRGRESAQLFRKIAEDQSYIIAASNEDFTRDSLQNNVPKVTRLMKRLLTSLPIDTKQVYVAGLKEGGQLASAIPVLYKGLGGVMAVGDAWLNPDYISKVSPFMFSAVVGDEDPAIYEMKNIVEFFDKAGFPSEINYFNGGRGEWPDTFVLSNAVAGFTLQAIKKGLRKTDSTAQVSVQQLYKNELDYAEMLRRKREYYPAYRQLEQMEDKYEDFGYKDEIRDKLKELRRIKAFRKQRRAYRDAAFEEDQKRDMYNSYLEYDLATTNFENVGWWASQMDELKEMEKSGDPVKQKMAARLEGYLKNTSLQRYRVIQATPGAGIDLKILASVLRTVIAKNDPEAYLNIIALAGHDGDYKTAMLYLEDLLKTGYDDIDALYNIEGILDLKLSPEYNELIHKYLGESKYYQPSLD
ncbi:MAG: hypothetical protein WBV11_00620 [Salegentibacter sp.]